MPQETDYLVFPDSCNVNNARVYYSLPNMVLPSFTVLEEVQGKSKIASSRARIHSGGICIQIEGPSSLAKEQKSHQEAPDRDQRIQGPVAFNHLLRIPSFLALCCSCYKTNSIIPLITTTMTHFLNCFLPAVIMS